MLNAALNAARAEPTGLTALWLSLDLPGCDPAEWTRDGGQPLSESDIAALVATTPTGLAEIQLEVYFRARRAQTQADRLGALLHALGHVDFDDPEKNTIGELLPLLSADERRRLTPSPLF